MLKILSLCEVCDCHIFPGNETERADDTTNCEHCGNVFHESHEIYHKQLGICSMGIDLAGIRGQET